MSSSFSIERVPVDEERQKLVTEQVFTLTTNARQTAQVLKFIGQHLPKLSGIEHVKRVKKHPAAAGQDMLMLVACQCSQTSRSELEAKLRGTEWEALEINVHDVPTTAPYTAEQYDLWKTVWPVSYRPPVHLRQVLSPDDRSYIEGILRDHVVKTESNVVVMCNRQKQDVLAKAVTDVGHPLKHATMCCIAKVAAIYKEQRQVSEQEQLSCPAKRPHSPDSDEPEETVAGYLCEGLDVFASREPCVMCTMALVHSRIGRLFFIEASPSSGGISRYSMHSLKSLNHHFTAFQCHSTTAE
ncbi:tRNA-specific adenosine deaminase subunit tad3 [Coemansia aciculifera]|uniref:tRNA-specific adenosine deaminase subunit tad3 n=1 Tax=Coemansia aciculifera TaxID=417176 RepID=A0ACC1M9H8_9FUNG|nr:tRNA-specific adenosine deaminase subunit tad3 [Coemansia aciculifera]